MGLQEFKKATNELKVLHSEEQKLRSRREAQGEILTNELLTLPTEALELIECKLFEIPLIINQKYLIEQVRLEIESRTN